MIKNDEKIEVIRKNLNKYKGENYDD